MQYNLLIRAHGKLGDPIQAEKILNRLEDLYQKSGDEDIRPTVITYTEVIDAYAKSHHAHSAENAERLLYLMMDRAQREDGTLDEALAPTSITCDAVLNAWARKGTREAAGRAEEILERMEYLRTRGNIKVQPTSYSFATVISAWARARFGRGEVSGKENAERAQFILRRMVEFRKQMEAKDKGGSSEYCKELEVDTVLYNSVMDAWARSKDPIAGTRAEELLFEMEEKEKTGGKAAPDTITYNSVINCHANSGHVNAAKAAERVLKKMEIAASTSNGRIAPNTMTYNQVLKAYSKSSLPGAAKRADMILTYMIQSGNESIQPDVISFSTCLDVWAKSKEPGKAEKAYLILQKMEQLYDSTGLQSIKPNEVTYNTVLNACAFSAFTQDHERKQALSLAVRLFNEMQKSTIVRPDAVTYGMLLKCIANLVPKGKIRNNMASDVFRKCIDNGLVNGLVFDEIRRALPGRLLSALLKDAQNARHGKMKKPLSLLELRDLPRSWRANVVEAKPKGKRKKVKTPAEDGIDNRTKESKSVKDNRIKPVMRVIVEQSWQSGRDV
jgi:PPR repeat.